MPSTTVRSATAWRWRIFRPSRGRFSSMRRRNGLYLAAPFLYSPPLVQDQKKEEAEAPAPVQVTAVTQDTIRRLVAGDGVLFPKDQASVSPKSRRPSEVLCQPRRSVEGGQFLAELENRDSPRLPAKRKARSTQAESNLRSTEGASVPEAIVKAQTDVDGGPPGHGRRQEGAGQPPAVVQGGALAHRQVDEAHVSYAQANSQFLSAQEHLRVLEAVAKDRTGHPSLRAGRGRRNRHAPDLFKPR